VDQVEDPLVYSVALLQSAQVPPSSNFDANYKLYNAFPSIINSIKHQFVGIVSRYLCISQGDNWNETECKHGQPFLRPY
jgi:hypothetical protein